MGLLDLFIASTIPVLKVLLITALGTFLALDRVDILREDARKHVNNVVFYVFNPALVASKLAETVTYESIVKLWFMPLNILITFIIGSILGWILVQFTRPPPHIRGLIVGCCAAGNLGNMFLIMIPAVCKEKGSPFGAPDVCQSYGLAYVSFSMAIGAIYLWSYVYNIVRASAAGTTIESTRLITGQSSRESSTAELGSCTEPLLPSKEPLASEHRIDQYALPRTKQIEMEDSGNKQLLSKLLGNINWKTVFAPSTTGAIVGFMIGLIPYIRKILIGGDAPLHVIQDTASLLGDGAIPTLTLILGGNLLKGLEGSGMQKSIIVGIMVARYIALPIIGIFIVKVRLGFIPADPLYQFVLLLQFAVPPAMNMGVITQLFGAGETECSVIMLWAYALASISLTLWSTLFMFLI
ncbi:LOW QUALITY PROTEIN: protein PIN-LIKES 3 [Hevea brasiliensis]|uniref:LOW QUALITY PROTEIN: protein PIN-LIKES 3 n=1 Tax=Hevea brasiliensis TaxID=3981 RepID=UPI0025D9AFBF|nr:LOW QUALITY PROTEIN: protein PIN-LIKES 3 [Hevea brasiliensis]